MSTTLPTSTHFGPGPQAVAPSSVEAMLLEQRVVTRYERLVKPVLDRAVAALVLLVLLPFLVILGVAVAMSLGRPVLFRQRRVGLGGRVFEVVKFRSMAPDRRAARAARDRLETASAEVEPGWSGEEDRRLTHKHPDDPRLSRLGRFLRRSSLDELPQLWNVIRGEMSLVGPRPELEQIVERYEPWQHRRHLVKPGVTGLWQVSERGNGLMHERVDVDIEYVHGLSLRMDLAILARTLPAALGSRKGY